VITPVDPDAYGLVWHQVARQILGLITAGKLKPGQRLPGETDLAREFGAARRTIRRALAWLAERGVVVAFPGRGTFIARTLPNPLPDPPDGQPL
jgi:DNA-binding GntR family transcriptional regulator